MQNTSSAHFRRMAMLAIVVAAWCAVGFAAAIALPQRAFAADYAMPGVDIAVEVNDAGDVRTVETRQFDFTEDASQIVWTLPRFSDGSSLRVNGVTLHTAAADGASTDISLQSVPFDSDWRGSGAFGDSGGADVPASPAYSWDGAAYALHIFLGDHERALSVTVDYTAVNAVVAYKDVGELYWRYVAADWPAASENVHATVTLPVPEGFEVHPGDDVRAWGHGPADGTVDFASDGSVCYEDPVVASGQYAEAHLVFPASWLSSLRESAREAHENENRLEGVLSDEQNWADSASAQATHSIMFEIAWLAVAALLAAAALAAYAVWGRNRRPAFDAESWREAPDPDLIPAAIGRLLSWNAPDTRQFCATLADLAGKGALRIEPAAPSEGGAQPDLRFAEATDASEPAAPSPVESDALDVLFGAIAGGACEVGMNEVRAFARTHPDALARRMQSWHDLVSRDVEQADLFDAASAAAGKTMRVVAFAYLAVAAVVAFYLGNAGLLIPVIPTVLVLLLVARFMPRHTQHGADVLARTEALRRHLQATALQDARSAPDDAAKPGALAGYAFLLDAGIASAGIGRETAAGLEALAALLDQHR